ncbi:MAG: hypothetical protein WB626_05255 [Bacteroidota bacterium]
MMRAMLVTLGAVCLGLVRPEAGSAGDRELTPRPGRPGAAVFVGGRVRSYHLLDARRGSTLHVRGPGEVRFVGRAVFRPGDGDTLRYAIRTRVDGGAPGRKEFTARRSRLAAFRPDSAGVPGEARQFVIRLGRGEHTVRFLQGDSLPAVVGRYLFRPSRLRRQKWAAVTPRSPLDPVELVAGGESVRTYRFSATEPLVLEVQGPTELRLLTRVEHATAMQGALHYRLQVRRGGKVVNTYLLSSRQSGSTAYRENRSRVPARAREIILSVPRGPNRYTILPLDEDKGAILAQAFIPERHAARRK